VAAAQHAYRIEYDRRLTPAGSRAPRRTGRVARRSSAQTVRLIALIAAPLIMVLAYVGLTAELAQQTYRLNADQTQQASLILTDDALHQRIAALQSVARLEAAAKALHMKEPAHIAVIVLPATSAKPTTTALGARFASLKRLFVAP
jgi:hypothetical protein